MSLDTQLNTALVILGMGVFFGMLLDIYRPLRPKGKAAEFFTDALFWSGYALLFFAALYRVNDGFIRIPFFIFLAAGIAFYFFLLRIFFLPVRNSLFFCVKTTYQIILGVIRIFLITPALFILRCTVSLARTSQFLLSWVVKVFVLRPWTVIGRLKK